MNKSQEDLIKKIAKKIDEDKYNPMLISRGYDKYLEGIFKILCEGYVELAEVEEKT